MKSSFLLVLQVSLFIGFIKAQNQPMDLTISRDSVRGENTLYMTIDEKLVDSVTIGDIDYIKDSLVRLNDTMWHYIYSIGFDTSHDMVTIRQLLIQNLNDKIHFSYVGDYNFHNVPDTNDIDIYEYDYQYDLSILTDSLEDKVNMNYFLIRSIDGENSIDSTQEVVYLSYDAEKKIYYSSIDKLKGEFNLYPEEPKGRKGEFEMLPTPVNFENEEVYTLKIGKSHYIYFKDRWFIVDEFPYHTNVISFLPMKYVVE